MTVILALMFMLCVVLVGVYVGRMLFNDQANAATYTKIRNTNNVAVSAANIALTSIRYAPQIGTGQTLNASPPTPCWGTSALSGITQGTLTANSWCSTQEQPASTTATRVVTIDVCLTPASASGCLANPLIQIIVNFGDFATMSGVQTDECTSAQSATCGESSSIVSWTGP